MTNDFPKARAALDAVPVPAVGAVDLAALYRSAFDRQATVARRWRRAAAALAAVAAGVVLVAILPRLEVRLNRDEFALRWGTPPAVMEPPPVRDATPAPDPRIPALLDDLRQQADARRAADRKLAELQELVLTLAVDVAERDKAQSERLAALARELASFQTAAAKRFDQTEQTSTTLYNVVFNAKPKPGG